MVRPADRRDPPEFTSREVRSMIVQGLLQPVRSQMYYKRFILYKGLFSDGIAVRPTAAAARYRGCVAMQCRLAGTLSTYW